LAKTLKLAIYVVRYSYWINVMTTDSNGSYTIEIEDNILVVDANGLFDEDMAKNYDQDMRKLVDKMVGQPWGSLVTYYGNSVFTPEAEETLIEMTKYRVQYGMIANATVIVNSAHADLQQMQLRRIYQASNITFHVFSDINSAREWLSSFLQQKAAI